MDAPTQQDMAQEHNMTDKFNYIRKCGIITISEQLLH